MSFSFWLCHGMNFFEESYKNEMDGFYLLWWELRRGVVLYDTFHVCVTHFPWKSKSVESIIHVLLHHFFLKRWSGLFPNFIENRFWWGCTWFSTWFSIEWWKCYRWNLKKIWGAFGKNRGRGTVSGTEHQRGRSPSPFLGNPPCSNAPCMWIRFSISMWNLWWKGEIILIFCITHLAWYLFHVKKNWNELIFVCRENFSFSCNSIFSHITENMRRAAYFRCTRFSWTCLDVHLIEVKWCEVLNQDEIKYRGL